MTMAAASMTALAYAQDGFGLPLDFIKHTSAPDFTMAGCLERVKKILLVGAQQILRR